MRKNAVLPDRCIVCNAPAYGNTITKRLSWHDAPPESKRSLIPLVSIGIAFSSMFAWFTSLPTFQTAKVRVGICTKHAMSCRLRTMVLWLALPTAIGVCIFLVESLVARLWIPVGAVFLMVLANRRPRPVRAVHMGVDHVTLEGAGPAFLAELPSAERPSDTPTVGQISSSVEALRDRMRMKR